MIGRLRMVMIGLTLIGLSACASSSVPETEAGAEPATTWRHWQPDAPLRLDAGLPTIAALTADNVQDPALVGDANHKSPPLDPNHQSTPVAAGHPRAVILALHGFNDYSNAFQEVATFFQERDITVHAYDQQSFGANANRGIWPGTEPFVADLKKAVQDLRQLYGNTPLYVLGESMGGAIAIVAAADEEDPLDVDGLILSAPAVWGGSHFNPFYRATLWFASTLAPGWALSPSGLEIRPSDNIEMLRAYSADPQVIKVTRTDAIAGLVALMDEALAAAPKLDQEILMLIGEKDEVVPVGALDDFADRLDRAEATTIRYTEGYHMLLRDLQRATVFADIDMWINRVSTEKIAGPTDVPSTSGGAVKRPVSKNKT